ncbi:MAG: hypothetical protein AAB224_07370 [Gemmatimonadota bacterium]
MSLWDKLNTELNRAGRAAQGAFDEGRLRIEIFRVRQLADKSAQALGYAVYRARSKGEELDASAWDRLAATLKEHEAEASRLEEQLAQNGSSAGATPPEPPSAEAAGGDAAAAPSTPPGAPTSGT